MKRILLAGIMCLMAATAFAHSSVSATTPENKAVLAEMPDLIVLTFAKRIRLTRISMTLNDGQRVDLDIGEQKSFLKKFELPAPDLGAGDYRIEWRGLAVDGHAMKGMFTFKVK